MAAVGPHSIAVSVLLRPCKHIDVGTGTQRGVLRQPLFRDLFEHLEDTGSCRGHVGKEGRSSSSLCP